MIVKTIFLMVAFLEENVPHFWPISTCIGIGLPCREILDISAIIILLFTVLITNHFYPVYLHEKGKPVPWKVRFYQAVLYIMAALLGFGVYLEGIDVFFIIITIICIVSYNLGKPHNPTYYYSRKWTKRVLLIHYLFFFLSMTLITFSLVLSHSFWVYPLVIVLIYGTVYLLYILLFCTIEDLIDFVPDNEDLSNSSNSIEDVGEEAE